ncbi:O-antigen ligase family protein [Patescibacteria group bacterium]|nr:O-antigen ligase family protein [Patescibacteria group bacterium]MBU1890221.1 O-antigen ligase family protein [Patescibacteria group bacterium]
MKKSLSRITEYLLYLYVFLMPWQVRWIIKQGELNDGDWEYGTYCLYGTEILLIILILLQLFTDSTSRPRKQISGLSLAMIGLVVVSGLSFFWSINRELTFFYWLKMLEGAALVWLMGRMLFYPVWLGRAFIGGATVQAIIGVGQFLSQWTFSSKWLGMAEHKAGVLGTYVVETDTERYLRAYGGLPHPNILAGLLVVAIVIIFGLYFDLYRRIYYWYINLPSDDRKILWFSQRPNILGFTAEIVYYLFCLILCTLGLIFTFSRSGWLAMIVGLGSLWLILAFKRDLKKMLVWAKLGLTMLIVLGVAFSMYQKPIVSRFLTDERLEKISIDERVSYQDQAVELLKNNWIVGVGLGNYTQAVYDKLDDDLESWAYQPVHNVFLLVPVEISAIGLIVLLFIIFEIIRRTWLNIRRSPYVDRWFAVGISLMLAVIVIGIFDHYLWSLYFGVILWWFCFGLFSKYSNR